MTRRADDHVSTLVERIQESTNRRDLEALVACFTDDYQSVWPQHPGRSFEGVDQVRRNWGQLFGSVPDLTVEVLSLVVAGEEAWTEWEFGGHHDGGAPFLLRCVIIFLHRQGKAARGRFFLEPVEIEGGDADEAVRELLSREEVAP
jgi:ketosteroid isomerase-like protein